jgi:putative aldouronate transport system substrate-binding protein
MLLSEIQWEVNMKKSVVIAIMSLVLAVVLLSDCSGNDTDGSSGSMRVTQTPEKATWFSEVGYWTPPIPWSTDPKTVQGVITMRTGLTFAFNIPPLDGATKLSLKLLSGEELPDVMSITNAELAKQLIDSGKVWNMEELLQRYDPESHLLTGFPPDLKQVLTERDGGWYAIPSHISTDDARKRYPPSAPYYVDGQFRKNNAIMVNRNILDRLGLKLEDIKTEEGLFAAYRMIKDRKLTVEGAPVIPLQVDGKDYYNATIETLQNMFGAMPVDKNGVYRDRLLAPETKQVLHFLYQAYRAGYFEAGQLTMDATTVSAAVQSGSVFSFIGNTANTGFSEQDYWVSPGPILSNAGTSPTLGRNMKAPSGWFQTYISKSTKYPEKLAKWLSFMSSDEGMTLHYYGFEGTHYTRNEKGLIVQTAEGRKASADFAKTGVFSFWPFHNVSWHDAVTEAPTVLTGADGLLAMQVQTAFGKDPATVLYDNSVFMLPVDFLPSGSELANDQEQINLFKEAQITTIVLSKNDAAFSENYDELIARLKELGIEEIDAKINKQVQKKMQEQDMMIIGVNS